MVRETDGTRNSESFYDMTTTYWKQHYVLETDPTEIERRITKRTCLSQGEELELVCFENGKYRPNILLIPGSGAHAYVFAELGYYMFRRGYNVFILPKNAGHTISELKKRYDDAVKYVGSQFGGNIGIYAEALGGMAAFYLALEGSKFKSLVCENSPAILTEEKFLNSMMEGKAGQRRKMLLPFLRILVKVFPNFPTPISAYVKWREVVDSESPNRDVENKLVDAYEKDPEFDTHYPLKAVMSLLTTPPPASISELRVPTQFIVAKRGFFPHYFKDLYQRLPNIRKNLVEVDGGVYWFLSHPKKAAQVICDWFDKTL